MSLEESNVTQKNDSEKKRYTSPIMKEIGRIGGMTKGGVGTSLDSGFPSGEPPVVS